MRYRRFASASAFALASALIGTAAVTVNGQAPSTTAQKTSGSASRVPISPGKIPRTLDGKPDFSGIWTGFLVTPLERPAGAPEFISREEMLSLLKGDQKERVELKTYPTATFAGGKNPDSYNTFWRDGYWEKWDQIVTLPKYRSWQVIDPPDGKLPAVTPRAKEMQRERRVRIARPPAGPEDLPIWSGRCVRGMASGPPLRASGAYNVNQHIVQGPDTFAVIQEMIHETQIVPLNGTPHPSAAIRLSKGDSRGHWEGDTLVIDTTNFIGATLFYAGPMNVGTDYGGGTSSEKLHVVERYTMLDARNILYRATVEDPDTIVRPYTIEFVLYRIPDQQQLVEYACHEGNRAIVNILSGARAFDAKGIKDPSYYGASKQDEEANCHVRQAGRGVSCEE
jgi:hypothetical protein